MSYEIRTNPTRPGGGFPERPRTKNGYDPDQNRYAGKARHARKEGTG